MTTVMMEFIKGTYRKLFKVHVIPSEVPSINSPTKPVVICNSVGNRKINKSVTIRLTRRMMLG